MKPVFAIAAAAALVGVGWVFMRRMGTGGSGVGEPRNDAASPRLPAMPAMPRMPAMPAMPGMPAMPAMRSGAAPNAPQIGPQAPAGIFAGMWG